MADDQTPTSQFANTFDRARDQAAHDKHLAGESEHLDTEMKIRVGKLGLEASHKIVNQARVDQLENTPEGREKRRQRDQHMVAEVLAQMDDRMRVLSEQMAERYLILQAKYGEDAIGGMAAEFLGDEAESLTNDEERLRALADRLLDEHGEIRPEFSGTDEALFIRDWNEHQMLAPTVNRLNSSAPLTANDVREVFDVVDSLSLAARHGIVSSTPSGAVNSAADGAASEAHASTDSVQTELPRLFN